MKATPLVIVVIGPTASGKSDFSVDLALQYNGEIISADSRQVYKSLDIGTGKITEEEMKGVKHHMLSVYDVGEGVSVARYARDAIPILTDIITRGKTPIICGGTGQYIDALIYGESYPHIPPDRDLRNALEMKSIEELFEALETSDPRRAATIDRHNKVRLVRALEIIHHLGTVPETKVKELLYETTLYILQPNKEVLRNRIAKRLEKRLSIGMLDEARALRTRAISDRIIERIGLEYKWMNIYLKNECNYEEMKQHILTASYQYAKRQITWNKKYASIAKIIEVKE